MTYVTTFENKNILRGHCHGPLANTHVLELEDSNFMLTKQSLVVLGFRIN